MAVTTHMQTFVVETVTTGIGGMRGVQDALRHEGQSLRGLEGRAWRVLSHDAAVQQGLPNILTQLSVTLGALAANHDARVVAGRTDHAEHFARRGLNGHDTAYLAFHQPLAQGLQVCINTQRQVLACHGATVELTILIASLHTSMGVAQQNLHAFLATQLFLVTTLHA